MTDANLLLGRLVPEFFPRIFGKSEDQPLDAEAPRKLFEELAKEINAGQAREMGLDEIVYGCVAICCREKPERELRGCADSSRSRMRRCAGRSARSPRRAGTRQGSMCASRSPPVFLMVLMD